MSIELYLAFLAVSCVIIIVPGPNVTLILATAAVWGMQARLMIVAGTTLAQILQVIAVALGLAWLVGAYGSLFDVLRCAVAAIPDHLRHEFREALKSMGGFDWFPYRIQD